MAPKQDPKPKFQEGNELSVVVSGRFAASVGAGAGGKLASIITGAAPSS